MLEKHSRHVTLRDAEFPAVPRCSSADVLGGVLKRKSYFAWRAALVFAVARASTHTHTGPFADRSAECLKTHRPTNKSKNINVPNNPAYTENHHI